MDNIVPSGGIVVFDSNCVLCSSTVRILIALDRKKKLRFTSFDSKLWSKLEEGFNGKIPFLNTAGHSESIVFYQFVNDKLPLNHPEDLYSINQFNREHYHFQSDAVIKIIETLSTPWNLLRVIKFIPKNLREKIYRIIARNRFLIFGRKVSCALPSENKKGRFIL